jgi:hypothetical protein
MIDTTAAHVSDRIAEILGWEPSKKDRDKWWDPHDQKETGFYAFNARDAPNFFNPLNDIQDALFAADRLADHRHSPFRLERLSDGQWLASFQLGGRNGETSGTQQIPCKAICEAILKVSDAPDPN